MSLLSDFLQKPYVGLSLSGDILSFANQHPALLIESLDASSGGDLYPRMVMRNNMINTTAGPNIVMQCLNTASEVIDAAAIRGTLSSRSDSAEKGKLQLLSFNGATLSGVEVYSDALLPTTSGAVSLGSNLSGFKSVYLVDQTNAYKASIVAGTEAKLEFTGASFNLTPHTRVQTLSVKSTGVAVLNANSSDEALLSVGGLSDASYYSQSSTDTGAGINIAYGAPSSQISLAAGMHTAMHLAAGTTWACGIVAHLYLGASTVGAGATATKLYGLYVTGQTVGATDYGIYVESQGNYGIVADGPEHAFGGAVVVKNATPFAAATATLDVLSGATSGVVSKVRATSASYAEAAGLLRVEGPDNDSTYVAVLVTDTTSSNTKFQVRGDGAVTVGTASPLSVGMFSVAGRVAITGNDVYDLYTNTVAVDLHVVATHAVDVSKIAQCARIEGSMALTGTGAEGTAMTAIATSSSHVAGANLYGGRFVVNSSGAGNSVGFNAVANANSGHSGTLHGASIYVNSQATTAASYGSSVYHGARLTAAFYVEASAPGAQLDHGVYVASASAVSISAFHYYQRSGSTADVLRYVESGGSTRFAISSAGDMTIAGTARRIRADMDNATASNRLTFQTSGSSAQTIVNTAPSSGGTQSGYASYSASDVDNASAVQLSVSGTATLLNSFKTGSGTTRPVQIAIDSAVALQVHTNSDIVLGPGSMATGATAGFPYIPTCAGAPTGAATARSGYAPIIVDETNSRVYVRVGSTWKYVAVA